MIKNRKAFTMLELVFVIVVIGILSAIAIPKFALTRNDAVITKAKTTIATVRSAISTTRQKNILQGIFDDLNKTTIGNEFTHMLEYNVTSCNVDGCNGWETGGSETAPTYTFNGPTGDVVYTYQNKKLECTSGLCAEYGN
jgi:general secretion pathway protein G